MASAASRRGGPNNVPRIAAPTTQANKNEPPPVEISPEAQKKLQLLKQEWKTLLEKKMKFKQKLLELSKKTLNQDKVNALEQRLAVLSNLQTKVVFWKHTPAALNELKEALRNRRSAKEEVKGITSPIFCVQGCYLQMKITPCKFNNSDGNTFEVVVNQRSKEKLKVSIAVDDYEDPPKFGVEKFSGEFKVYRDLASDSDKNLINVKLTIHRIQPLVQNKVLLLGDKEPDKYMLEMLDDSVKRHLENRKNKQSEEEQQIELEYEDFIRNSSSSNASKETVEDTILSPSKFNLKASYNYTNSTSSPLKKSGVGSNATFPGRYNEEKKKSVSSQAKKTPPVSSNIGSLANSLSLNISAANNNSAQTTKRQLGDSPVHYASTPKNNKNDDNDLDINEHNVSIEYTSPNDKNTAKTSTGLSPEASALLADLPEDNNASSSSSKAIANTLSDEQKMKIAEQVKKLEENDKKPNVVKPTGSALNIYKPVTFGPDDAAPKSSSTNSTSLPNPAADILKKLNEKTVKSQPVKVAENFLNEEKKKKEEEERRRKAKVEEARLMVENIRLKREAQEKQPSAGTSKESCLSTDDDPYNATFNSLRRFSANKKITSKESAEAIIQNHKRGKVDFDFVNST